MSKNNQLLKIPNIYPCAGPLYWRDEQSGVLIAVVGKYLHSQAMTDDELTLLRDYLRYYVNAPCWSFENNYFADELAMLRTNVNELKTSADIHKWLFEGLEIGLDPL